MKITIPKQEMLDAVSKVKTVVSLKSALPILSHILIEAKDNQLRLAATDLKVSIEYTVDCDVEEPGTMTVAAQRIASILSELPEADITLEMKENKVILLKCGKIETRLFSMSADEFPPIRQFENIEPLILKQGLMKKMFSKTSFAICNDQARYNLTGLLFEIAEGKITTVATDGRRMSLYQRKQETTYSGDVRVIIPGKMVNELERLLGEDENVEIFIDETQAGFKFGALHMVTSLIEGTFPNYDMVVPKKHDKEAYASTASFMESVRRTRTMTNDKFNSVRFLLDNNVMTLRVVTPEVGEYEEEIPIEYDGERIEIAFNPDFVADVLRHIEGEKVCLQLKDAMSPGMIRPGKENSEEENYINVVMPIRI